MGRRRIAGWDEEDAYTGWRKYYCYLDKAGAVRYIKRKTHRRERREAKRQIQEEREMTVEDMINDPEGRRLVEEILNRKRISDAETKEDA